MQTTSAPVVFNFTDHSVRIVTDDHDNPWFAATDICNVLGYANSRQAVQKNCKTEGVSIRDTPTSSGIQPLTFINEGNLYRLIVKSRKPEAEKFEAWLMDDVLPSIRKTGGYAVPPAPTSPTIADAIAIYRESVQALLLAHDKPAAHTLACKSATRATGIDLESMWALPASANLSSLPPLPWANKSKKPAVPSRREKQIERLARYLRHPERLAGYSTTYAVSRDLIADLLAKGYIARQVLLKRMHCTAAEFNLLIAEGKEAGIVRELDGIEFNYAGVLYVAGGAA